MMSRTFLLVLSAANFVIGFGAFVVIGLVEPIAEAYKVSPAFAGNAMTAYAIAYAIGSPIAVSLTGKLARHIVLGAGIALFCLGSLASAFAPTLEWLFAARVIAALGAGLFTPSAAAVGAALASPEKRAQTLATIFAGLTIAQVVGVPAGTWLGYTYGPGRTFMVVAALALIAALAVIAIVPRDVKINPTSLSALGKVLRTPHLIMAVSFTATFLMSVYVLYTYLGPLLTEMYGLDKNAKTLMFLIFGSAAVLGNFLGSWGVGRIGSSKTLMMLSIVHAVLLFLVPNVVMGVVITALLLFVWSLAGWSFMTPQQTRLVAIDPTQIQPLFALNASCIYFAAAIGSAIGSVTINNLGFGWLGLVAALAGLLAVAHLWLSDRMVKVQKGAA
jgi:MFS transporter, DHA1 family, inner membrane transport protein